MQTLPGSEKDEISDVLVGVGGVFAGTEPLDPDRVSAVNEADRNPVDLRSAWRCEDLSERQVRGEKQINTLILVFDGALNPFFSRPLSPCAVGTFGHAVLVQIVAAQVQASEILASFPNKESADRRLPRATRTSQHQEHGTHIAAKRRELSGDIPERWRNRRLTPRRPTIIECR
jgi:hypothetical protein